MQSHTNSCDTKGPQSDHANPDHSLEKLGYCWVPAEATGTAGSRCALEERELIPAGRIDWTPEEIEEVLHKHGISKDSFQQNQSSKEFDALVQELLRGECSLHSRGLQGSAPDATPGNGLLRIVNLFVLAIVDPLHSCVLVEVKQRASGKERSTGQLPGKKLKPLQNLESAIHQYLETELRCRHLLGELFELDISHVSEREDEDITPSRNFPSLASMYRKYTIQGHIILTTEEGRNAHPSANKLGLLGGAGANFKTKSRKTGDLHFWEWRPLCAGVSGEMSITAPVPLEVGPRGWSSTSLLQLVTQHLQMATPDGSDEHPPKKPHHLEELAAELTNGQCSLRLKADGNVWRQVDILRVELHRWDGEVNQVLCRAREDAMLPELLKVNGEAPQQVAERFLTEQLGLQGSYVINASSGIVGGSCPMANMGCMRVRAPGLSHPACVRDCPLLNTVVRESVVEAWI